MKVTAYDSPSPQHLPNQDGRSTAPTLEANAGGHNTFDASLNQTLSLKPA